MSLEAFPFGTATDLARAVRDREVSAVELLQAQLARVDRLNPALNAIVVDDRERALRDARAADAALARGDTVGPLHGVPMTVKESFDVAGLRTTQGYVPLRDNVATGDALAVERLRAAGAVIFGKTNVPLFLSDFQSYNAIYGTTNNPWDVARTPGGSSGGGAAAVAAGLTALEYGSDIGGSIRNPAAYCGVYGHKPTWTIVPKRGHTLARTPVAEADLSVIGPLARSARDLALALRVTAGPDRLVTPGVRFDFPPPPADLGNLRVAVWLEQPDLSPVSKDVRDGIVRAAEALREGGAQVDFEARPAFDPAHANGVYQQLLWSIIGARRADFDQLRAEVLALSPTDTSVAAQRLRSQAPWYRDFFVAANQREELRWAWRRFFDGYDCVLAPITATTAFPQDQSEPPADRTMQVDGRAVPYFAQLFWAGLATCSWLPATAMPVGRDAAGLPIGMQVIGPEMGDFTTLWVAQQLEDRLGAYTPPPAFAA